MQRIGTPERELLKQFHGLSNYFFGNADDGRVVDVRKRRRLGLLILLAGQFAFPSATAQGRDDFWNADHRDG